MNVSGARVAADIDLEDFEKRLRTAGTPAGGVEDPLAELARLVEASRPKAAGGQAAPPLAAARRRSPPRRPSSRRRNRLRRLRRPSRPPRCGPPSTTRPILSPRPTPRSTKTNPRPRARSCTRTSATSRRRIGRRRSRRWLWTVSTLAIAGVAMIGAVFALKGRTARHAEGAAVHRRRAGPDQGAAAERRDGLDAERRWRLPAQGQHAGRSRDGGEHRGAARRSARPDGAAALARAGRAAPIPPVPRRCAARSTRRSWS